MNINQAPRCVRCSKRHRPDLPCWRGPYSTGKRRRTLTIKGRTCWLCGLPDADTADHVVPRSRGGSDDDDNLMPAHRSCNVARGDTLAPDYVARAAATALVAGSRKWLPDAPAAASATDTRG